MEQYLEKGREVLKILLNNGCEAYIIGDAVIRLIMGMPIKEIDITTNATPEMIKGIFENAKVEDLSPGSVLLTYMGYTFKIRTFRLEEKYKDNRKPLRLHYSKNLKDELAACDFTINAICLSYGLKITDAYKGYDDIRKKKIKTIGSPKVRFYEDPLRILIGIAMVSEYGFKIDKKTLKGMRRRAKLLANIDPLRMKDVLKKIFEGKYFKKAIRYLVETKAYKYIKDLRKGIYFLAQHPKKKSIDTILACSYILNKKYSTTWDFLTDNSDRLKRVVELALINPKSKYDPYLLFTYGLDVCLDSNYVMHLLRKAKNKQRKIKKQYNSLIIKSMSELNFTSDDFLKISVNAKPYIDLIMKDVITKVLKGELNNEYYEIKRYVVNALEVYGVEPSINEIEEKKEDVYREYNEYVDNEENKIEDEKFTSQDENNNFVSLPSGNEINTIDDLKRKVIEIEKTLREKDQKIKELERQALEYKLEKDINVIVDQNLELLRDLNYIENGSEKILLSRELKEIYKGIIKNVNSKYRLLNEEKEGSKTNDESEN